MIRAATKTRTPGERPGSGHRKPVMVVLMALLAFVLTGVAVWAQGIQLGGLVGGPAGEPVGSSSQADAAKKGHVSQVSDAVEVEAGKPQLVELVFRVDQGFHINSHTPKDELLIPTVFRLDGGATKVLSEVYPAGSAFRLSLPGDRSAGETLDVYQGDFRVGLRVIAPPGSSTLTGSLRYQACDNAACFPARTLPVRLAITGR